MSSNACAADDPAGRGARGGAAAGDDGVGEHGSDPEAKLKRESDTLAAVVARAAAVAASTPSRARSTPSQGQRATWDGGGGGLARSKTYTFSEQSELDQDANPRRHTLVSSEIHQLMNQPTKFSLSSVLTQDEDILSSPNLRRRQARRRLANGDSYEGGWEKGRPHGLGLYMWADGSEYKGQWINGKKHGVGKYVWPSGAFYDGEWSEGTMQGFGRLESTDGSTYSGSWFRDQKHGLGLKQYKNGDVYEGLWLDGMAEGPGMYRWTDGSEYNGEWKQGRMHGRGTFVWPRGERYDGEWCNGREHGRAVFSWPDRSYYDGVWQDGEKYGIGVWVPALGHDERLSLSAPIHTHKRPMGMEQRTQSAKVDRASMLTASWPPPPPNALASARPDSGGSGAWAAERQERCGRRSIASDPERSDDERQERHGRRSIASDPERSDTEEGEEKEKTRTPKHICHLLQEYRQGVLVWEERASAQFLRTYQAPTKKKPKKKVKLVKGARNKQKLGETIFKGHRSYDLMLNLQLGVRWSVQRTNVEGAGRELTKEDFRTQPAEVAFPRQGRKTPPETPPHASGDFKWKDYAPHVFRQLRAHFGIDAGDYVRSLCGDKALREMSSPGKSGSVFFLSHDERFVCKTMNKEEMVMLRQMLREYYAHVKEHSHTMLTKFYGLHRVKPHRGRKVRFVVMGNLFCTDIPLHRKFDLKGSTQGRLTSKELKPTTIFKDLDIDLVFMLKQKVHDQFKTMLRADLDFLERVGVMDYSLLLGVHFHDPAVAARATGLPPPTAQEAADAPPTPPATPPAGSGGGGPFGGESSEGEAGREAESSEGEARRGVCTPGDHGKAAARQSSWEAPTPGKSPAAFSSVPGTPGTLDGGERPRTDLEVLLSAQSAEGPSLAEGCRWEGERIAAALNYRPWTLKDTEHFTAPGMGGMERGDSGRITAASDTDSERLGVNVPAVVRPKRIFPWPESAGPHREPLVTQPSAVVLNFGIIDILQSYNIHKQAEHTFKGIVHGMNEISAVDPSTYAKRMINFFDALFES